MKYIFIVALLLSSIFAKVNVAVSIPPQEYILEQIAPNMLNTALIVKPGNSPHTYEPKPSQMVEISKARIYFAIGVEFENVWLDKFKAQNKDMLIIHSDKNITKYPITQGEEAGELDPHIWLACNNIKIIAKNMANALIKADSNNSKIYQANLEKFLAKVDAKDKDIKEKLETLKNRQFLTFHPSWGYFAKEYNLTQLSIQVSGKEPSPKELINIIKLAKKYKVKAIFAQPEFSSKSANLIANELNIKVVKISPLAKDILANLDKFTNALLGK